MGWWPFTKTPSTSKTMPQVSSSPNCNFGSIFPFFHNWNLIEKFDFFSIFDSVFVTNRYWVQDWSWRCCIAFKGWNLQVQQIHSILDLVGNVTEFSDSGVKSGKIWCNFCHCWIPTKESLVGCHHACRDWLTLTDLPSSSSRSTDGRSNKRCVIPCWLIKLAASGVTYTGFFPLCTFFVFWSVLGRVLIINARIDLSSTDFSAFSNNDFEITWN